MTIQYIFNLILTLYYWHIRWNIIISSKLENILCNKKIHEQVSFMNSLKQTKKNGQRQAKSCKTNILILLFHIFSVKSVLLQY